MHAFHQILIRGVATVVALAVAVLNVTGQNDSSPSAPVATQDLELRALKEKARETAETQKQLQLQIDQRERAISQSGGAASAEVVTPSATENRSQTNGWLFRAQALKPSTRAYFDTGNDDEGEIDLFKDGNLGLSLDAVSLHVNYVTRMVFRLAHLYLAVSHQQARVTMASF